MQKWNIVLMLFYLINDEKLAEIHREWLKFNTKIA